MKRWQVAPEQELRIIPDVESAAGLSANYLWLLLLSTVIATFGLLANSTATVIGAMIVAPLMGPILGIGLALARGETDKLRRALWAELVGVALCLGVSILIGLLVGAERLDYTQSEIEGRTHPTLFDLAVGMAAGLAGAYASVNPRVSGSTAGVAIAVALVPPLCVSGLCAAGALSGFSSWSSAFGAFLLFFANFLTIQVAAVSVFLVSGLGHWEKVSRQAVVFNLLLLSATGWFLGRQLQRLFLEQKIEHQARLITIQKLRRIPGAHLDFIRVRLQEGKGQVELLTRAVRQLPASLAAEIEAELSRAVELPIELRIGTALSSYVSSSGALYQEAPDPGQLRLERVRSGLQTALQQFPGADLEFFRELEDGRLLVAVASPYVFDAGLVSQLQEVASKEIGEKVQLTVRTTTSQVHTAQGPVLMNWERQPTAEERRQAEIEALASFHVSRLISEFPGAWVDALQIRPLPEGRDYQLFLTLYSPRPVPQARFAQLAKALEADIEEGKVQVVVRNGLGRSTP